MTVTVLDSADLVESVTTGKVPVPPGIAEDNAAQAAKREAAKPQPKATHTVVDNAPPKERAAEAVTAETTATEEADDIEGDDGLTPRQKREFTAAMQKTIAKKHRLQREAEEIAANEYNRGRLAEERASRLERELEAANARLKPAETIIEEAKPPERAKFETEEAYQDALIDYRVDQRLKAKEAQEERAREEQEQQETLQHARANIERAIELVPDYKEVTEAVDMAVPPHIASYMQKSDMFGELGYHFAKNPDVLQKLTDFTANVRPGTQKFVDGITRSLVELGKIESKLQPFSKEKVKNGEGEHTEEPSRKNGAEPSQETGSAPSKPRVQAPIIRPLNAGGGAQVTKDEADMSTAEVITAWQRKHGVKLTARKRH
jgi:hypothetical protein